MNVDSDREIDMTTARRPLAIDEVSGSGIGTASGSESSELSFSAKSDESRFLQYVIEPMKPQHVACFCREDGSTCIKHNQAYPRLVEVVRLTNQMVKECREDDATMAELLQQLDTEVDESLVARQDTFKQKVVKAYCRRAEEAQMLRKQLDAERKKTLKLDSLTAENKSLYERIATIEEELEETRAKILPPDYELQASARSQGVTIDELRKTIADFEQKCGKLQGQIDTFNLKE